MKKLTIGYDYHMGKGRSGDYEKLKEIGASLGFGVERLAPVSHDDAIVSSTRIRDLVQGGDVWAARPLLGRFYQVKGEVVHGMKRGGDLLGFPTANLKLVDELFPKNGVYAILVEMGEGTYKGVANIGYSPTFDDHLFTVEVHILDFDERIYDQEIRVNFVKRIRDEKKFASITELADQIKRDVIRARKILSL